jgi:hypothetical protein
LAQRLVKWIVFGVVLGLIPVAFKVGWIKLTGEPSEFGLAKEQTLTWFELASYKGELLLLAVGISAAGIGDLLGSGLLDPPWPALKILVGGFCLINLMLGCMLYAVISEVYQRFGLEQIATVTLFSLISFIGAVIASGVCVALAQE